MTRIAVVSAGVSQPSSTRLLADRLAEATVAHLADHGVPAEVETFELRPMAHELADNVLTGFPTGALATAVEQVATADALIAVTPVFAASYSGLFKMFFDVLEPGALTGKPVVIAATGGTARHSLVLEHAARPLFAHLRAVVAPTAVFAATEDFGSTQGNRLADRIDRAGRELAGLVLGAGPAGAATEDDFTPFPDLLGGAG